MKMAVIALLVAIVSVLHIAAPAGPGGWRWAHIVFPKLYYVPLLMAAYCIGTRGTIATAAAVTAVYLAHIAAGWSGAAALRTGEFGEIAGIWVITLVSMVLFDRERCAVEAAEKAHEETLSVLASSLELREHETALHSNRVRDYTLLLAERMGLEGGEARDQLRTGAYFHDVGKIGLPDRILLKGEGLSDEEWKAVRQHPEAGAALIGKLSFLDEARGMVLAHHEKFDGTGYPAGLAGDRIPVGARIFAVVDVLDALTTERPYRLPLSFRDAAAHIRSGRGAHFDPAVVDAFLQVPFAAWAEAARRNGVTLREA